MSYVDKYNIGFKDIQGNDLKLTIQEDGYTGTVSNLITGGEPIEITHAGEGVRKYEKYTFGSKLRLNLYNLTQNQYLEFLNTNDRQFKFKLEQKKASIEKYTGSFKINSLASSPYQESFTDVSPSGCRLEFTKNADGTTNNSWLKLRIKIGGAIKATYEPNMYSGRIIEGTEALNALIANLIDVDSSYEGADTDDNDLNDRIIKSGSTSFTDAWIVEREEDGAWVEGLSSGDSGNFGGGYVGDN
ncbi:MAG: hypothetical protein R6U65_08500, partial [Perlabentimonas sp.]